jgi:hypothetical protein
MSFPLSSPLQDRRGFHKYKATPLVQTISNWAQFNNDQTNYVQGGTWEAIEARITAGTEVHEGLGYF